VYARIIEEALGSDVEVLLPAPGGDATISSDEFSLEPFLPATWRRVELPGSLAGFLSALRESVGAVEVGTVFVLAPWLASRELPEKVRAAHGHLGLHEIALLIAAECAPAGSRLASLLPYTTLAGEPSRGFRAEFFTRAHADLVLVHDGLAGETGLHSGYRTATVVATAGQTAGVTRFFRPARDVSEPDVVADLKRLTARGGGSTTYGFVLRSMPPPGSSLSPELRSPEIAQLKTSLEHLGDLRPIQEIFEFRTGLNVASEPSLVSEPGSEHNLPRLLEGSHIRNGSIAWDSVGRCARVDEPLLLKAGDVLVRSVTSGRDDRLDVAEFSDEMPAACAASTVIVLRPRKTVTPDQRRVAIQYLSSRLAMRVVHALGAGGPQIAVSLRRILIPVPDADLDLAISELRASAQQFREWALEADSALSDLFEEVTPEEWRAQVLRAGYRVRERERAAHQVEELGFRVRTLFPYPLAHTWRVVEASRSDYDGYKTVLEATETLLVYVAVLALVGAQALEEPVPYVRMIADRLSEWPDRGVSMGDWSSILEQVRGSKSISGHSADMPFPEVLLVWTSDEERGALERLKSRRNDDGHVRRPEDAELPVAYGQARADLTTLFEAADFLVDYPLRLIEGTRWREVDQATDYDYRDLRGDHPMVPLETDRAATYRIESGSLYFGTRRRDLYRVSPLLVRMSCPRCLAPATFCFDKLNRATRAPVYRALEHRHTAECADLAEALRAIGFLKEITSSETQAPTT